MRNVLLVSYHFPPDAAVGALRCQKFVKHLPEYGWAPHVLTVREKYYPRLDPSRLGDIRRAPVWRTSILPNPRIAALGFRARLYRALGRDHELQQKTEAATHITFEQKQRVEPGIWGLLRHTLISLCWLPDEHLGWLPPALIRGIQICRQHGIETLVTSSPPPTSHLIGLWLKRLMGVRWIADFRDPWTRNPARLDFSYVPLLHRLETAMERAVVIGADQIMLVNDRLRHLFERTYSDEPDAKFVTIWNGFDPDDFPSLGEVVRCEEFTLVHVGSLYYRRSPMAFLVAVANLIQEKKISVSEIRVIFIGEIGDGHQFEAFMAPLGLSAVVTSIGPVPYGEALAWMRRAHLLLLFAQDQPDQIPGKTFEYIATGTPVLAITEDGATADLVLKTGGQVSPDDPEMIKQAIYQCYLQSRSGTRGSVLVEPWTRAEVRPYDRRLLTGQLAALLEGRAC